MTISRGSRNQAASVCSPSVSAAAAALAPDKEDSLGSWVSTVQAHHLTCAASMHVSSVALRRQHHAHGHQP